MQSQIKLTDGWDKKLFRILGREDAAAEEFIAFAKNCIERFESGVPPYRQPPTKPTANWTDTDKTGLQVAEELEKALLDAERCLSILAGHNLNDPSFFLNAISRILQKGQEPDEIQQIIGREPFSGRATEAIPQFSALSSLLRSAAQDMSDKWRGNLKAKKGGGTDRPQGKPLDALTLDLAMAYRRIFGEIPTATRTMKFARIVKHLLSIVPPAVTPPNGYKDSTIGRAIRAACGTVKKRQEVSTETWLESEFRRELNLISPKTE